MTASLSSPHNNDLSEQQVIGLFSHSPLPDEGIGIGDDCAVIESPNQRKRLISTDQLVENVHFKLDAIDAEDLGHKSLAVNLSDIAAMGGKADGFFLSIAIPETLSLDWLNEFRNGLMTLAQQYDVPLLGGDTSRSETYVMISITIMGMVDSAYLKLRSTAIPADRLCVTGPLGDSAAGFSLLSHPPKYQSLTDKKRSTLIRKHCRPDPQVKEGQWLAQQEGVHAMIDLSDGLLQDAGHIAEQSSCRVDLNLDQLPLSGALEEFCSIDRSSKEAQEFAAAGGEDYELLLSVSENHFADVKSRFKKKFDKPLYEVGRVTEGENKVKTLRNGSSVAIKEQEFKHFKGS